ncbi:MAG TPA: VOC family protein [Urbifossiella sp.]|nr:VOC family protein [Urbifossiella sp.]
MTAATPAARPAPPAPRAPAATSSFSLTLHVSDVPRAVAFYRVLFDREPAKHYVEYAEFVVPDPAVVIGLLHVTRYPGMPTNRIGLCVPDPARLEAIVTRLALAGVPTHLQSGGAVTVTDPDGNQLVLTAEKGEVPADEGAAPVAFSRAGGRVTWEHRICSPIPAAIPHPDGGVDEVTLQATSNANPPPGQVAAFLAEVWRVLRPGGRVLVTGLVGDKAVDAVVLPGMASRLKSLSVEHAPMTALMAAGFVDLHYELFGDIICFQTPGIDMRKIRLHGIKPGGTDGAGAEVRYRGPLASVESDTGVVFPRGVWVGIPADEGRRLRQGPAGGQFEFRPVPN